MPPIVVTGEQIRATLLEVVREYDQRGPGYFQLPSVVSEAAQRLGIRNHNLPEVRALLTFASDLFRQGQLAWGHDLANQEAPFVHLTALGRETLAHLSRDPANPGGYLAHLQSRAALSPVALSYVQEALATYNAACFKAASVMIGAASERAILDLRDAIVTRLGIVGRSPGANLQDWRIARVVQGIESELVPHRGTMPRDLKDAYDSFWQPFVHQVRLARNAAGHPAVIDPVTPETVQASLLIFPELAHLAAGLATWTGSHLP